MVAENAIKTFLRTEKTVEIEHAFTTCTRTEKKTLVGENGVRICMRTVKPEVDAIADRTGLTTEKTCGRWKWS